MKLEEQIEKILARHLAVGFFGVKEMVDAAVVEVTTLVRDREKAAKKEGWELGIDGGELDSKPFDPRIYKGYNSRGDLIKWTKEQPK